MRPRLRRNLATQMVAASCALAAVVLAIITVLLVAVNREQAITERVQRAGDSALAATEIRTLVVDMQAGQRGYLLTNQRRFLEPYTAARDRWRSPGGRQLLRDLGAQRDLVRRRIDSLIDDYLAVTIRLARREPEQVEIMVDSGLGKARVDLLRAQLGGLIGNARADRQAALADLRRAERDAVRLAAVGIGVAALLLVLFTLYLARAIVAPVRRVAIAARRMSGGDLEARVRGAESGRGEIGEMARSFNTMAGDLSQRTAALERRYDEVRAELDRAAGLQRRLLPDRAPVIPGLALAGACLPAADVGGDYFDYVVDGHGRVTVLIADVAGHGIASALVMAMVRQVVRREVLAGAAPADVLRVANDELFSDLATVELFVTAFCVRADPRQDRLEIANAGHNLPLLRRTGGAGIDVLDADGIALGIVPGAAYEARSVSFGAGDALLLYTDGVVEAEDDQGRPLGDAALRDVAASLDGVPEVGVARVVDAVRRHAGGRPPSDDVTVVVGCAT